VKENGRDLNLKEIKMKFNQAKLAGNNHLAPKILNFKGNLK